MSRATLRALVDAATPGPWWADTVEPADVVVWSGDDPRWVANVGNWARQNPEAADESRWRQAVEASTDDAAFIAASRTAVPLLLAVADAAANVLGHFVVQTDHDRYECRDCEADVTEASAFMRPLVHGDDCEVRPLIAALAALEASE